MADLLLGIDIGGTKISVSVGADDGSVLASERFATDHSARPEAVIDRALERLPALVPPDHSPRAIGLACPGPLSAREGRFLDPPNMPGWHGFELMAHLQGHTELPARMMNDASAGALAEWLWGAGRGCANVVFFTMATGMGAGLVLDGHLVEGPDDLAGEIGHIRLDPDGPVGFGKRGSVEGYLSGPGMSQLARSEALAALQRGETTALLAGRELHAIDARVLCEAARTGDPAARRAITRSADALGRLIAMLTDLLNPDVFVLGTIGTANPDLFIEPALAVLHREALPRAAARVRIRPSGLGEHRGDRAALAVARTLLPSRC